MYTHRKFLFLKFINPWVKFDTLESIDLIPIDRQNVLDYCPICMKSLGTKSTREHKLHDITYHKRTEKEMYDDLYRNLSTHFIILIIVFTPLIMIAVIPNMYDDVIYFFYSQDVKNFIKSCQDVTSIYNAKLRSGLDYSLFMEIKESEGVCFDNLLLPYSSNQFFAERYYNMTK